MRVLVGSMVVALAGVAAYGQQATSATPARPPVPAVAGAPEARVIAELAASVNQLGGVKNSPFSADEINESVQVLADGNRITHSSTNKVFRNGEGRMRRDMPGGVMGGVMGSTFTLGGGTTIVDPAQGQQVLLDAQAQIARVAELRALPQAVTVVEAPGAIRRLATEDERAKALLEIERSKDNLVVAQRSLEKVNQELALTAARAPVAIVSGQGGLVTGVGTGVGLGAGSTSRYETRTEELGTRDFDGVTAEGRRTVTTIPAGAIGNERPIEIVYERWFSKDLGMVVYSKRSDPRTGEQTYELKNIVRAEPDPSLFNIPNTYRKISSTGTVYRTSPVATTAPTKKVRPQN